jgi:nucleotide-binding universal stress UspA family protein
MRSLSHILLPVDFSERAAGAARYAKLLAGHFHSTVTLLHVITPTQYEFGAIDIGGVMAADLYQNRNDMAVRDLDAFLASEWEGTDVRRVVVEGDPAQEIVGYAHAEGAGLILMPTHGFGPFRRFILGSNTAKVLHDADCPVWTGVHLEETPAEVGPVRTILCAVDLGPQSAAALEWASHLAGELCASLTLLHVASCPTASPEAAGHATVLDAAREELARLQDAVGAPAGLRVEAGEACRAICGAACLLGASLLVIGRGSASGVFGRLRTNSYAIIRQSPCPVVSV